MNDLSQLRGFVEHNEPKTYRDYPAIPEDIQQDWQQANWILNNSGAPWLRMLIDDVPYKEMLAEAQSLRHRFVRHRLTDGEGWLSLCVHGIAADMTDAYQAYQLNEEDVVYDWTDIKDEAPITVAYFRDRFPYLKYHRLRFMLMEPGGYIMPHSDNRISNLGAAVNISLNNPQGCRMVTENGVLPFDPDGSVYMFNNHYMHAVVNDSTEDRFHMIVHGHWNPPVWNDLILKSYKAAQNG